MSESQVHEFFRTYIETLNAHEFHRLPEFMHEEIIENAVAVSREEMIAKMTSLGEAVPDFTWRPQEVLVSGDRLAARMLNTATHTNEWLGVAPTQRRLELAEFSFHRLRDGRFCEVSFLIDVPAVLQQMSS